MQAVILAGGKGERLGTIIPKPMVKVGGKPVIQHQIDLLKQAGITDIHILLGYRGEVIKNYLKRKINYHFESKPLGTAGAVKNIERYLKKDFLLLYGDVMLNFDIKRFIKFHRGIGSLVVHPNDHPMSSDLVELTGNRITKFYPKPPKWFHNMAVAGVAILSPKVLKTIPLKKLDFGKNIYPKLNLQGYNTWEYFKDIGTPQALKQVRQDYKTGLIQQLNFKNKQQAIFLDRDGVLNYPVNNLSRVKDLVLYPFVAEAIRRINHSKYLPIVITNQPMIAKGFMTEQTLDKIHKKLETLLGGAKLMRIYYCPHHPTKGFKGEVKHLKIKCQCRKPNIGMIKQAQKDFNLDLNKCYFVGDTWRDEKAAERAKVKFNGHNTLKVAIDHILR